VTTTVDAATGWVACAAIVAGMLLEEKNARLYRLPAESAAEVRGYEVVLQLIELLIAAKPDCCSMRLW
jgi:hypothetical protein